MPKRKKPEKFAPLKPKDCHAIDSLSLKHVNFGSDDGGPFGRAVTDILNGRHRLIGRAPGASVDKKPRW